MQFTYCKKNNLCYNKYCIIKKRGRLYMKNKKDEKINFVRKRYEKIMNHWMEISYDWCISRQVWWGQQIPAWYNI